MDKKIYDSSSKRNCVQRQTLIFQEKLELQFGLYNGEVSDNKPHGKGGVTFYPDDLGGRKVFDGTWVNGRRDGPGKMTWTTGEVKYKIQTLVWSNSQDQSQS